MVLVSAAWGLGAGVNREQAVAGWFEAADAILAERARSPSPAQRLARAVRLSRLSEAASWAWRGQIDAGAAAHACGVTTASAVLCWGQGDVGQLGVPSVLASASPVRVPGVSR